jgi:hypothetical protein
VINERTEILELWWDLKWMAIVMGLMESGRMPEGVRFPTYDEYCSAPDDVP